MVPFFPLKQFHLSCHGNFVCKYEIKCLMFFTKWLHILFFSVGSIKVLGLPSEDLFTAVILQPLLNLSADREVQSRVGKNSAWLKTDDKALKNRRYHKTFSKLASCSVLKWTSRWFSETLTAFPGNGPNLFMDTSIASTNYLISSAD